MSGDSPKSELTALADEVRSTLAETTAAVSAISLKVDHVVQRVDDFHLNGHGPAIVALAGVSTQLVTMAKVSAEREAFWGGLVRRIGPWKWVIAASWTGFIASVFYWLVPIWLHLPGAPK